MLLRSTLAPALLLLLLPLLLLSTAEAARKKRPSQRLRIACPGLRAQKFCDGGNSGLRLYDGCNSCTCSSEAGRPACSLVQCPTLAEMTTEAATARQRRAAQRYCARMGRRQQRKLRRHSRRHGAGGSRSMNRPMKCFNERRFCRRQPDAEFFDGCNVCRCRGRTPDCAKANTCADFSGTRREFRRECRKRGAGVKRQGSLLRWFLRQF